MTTNHHSPGPRRVLIVEDQHDIATSLAQVCTLLQHDVRIADTGEGAITEAAEFAPDIVFLDIGLPDLTGYEVARRLRASPISAHAVIVTLSGWSQPTVREQALAAGVDRHLVKPATLAMLRETLALHRDPGSAGSAGAAASPSTTTPR